MGLGKTRGAMGEVWGLGGGLGGLRTNSGLVRLGKKPEADHKRTRSNVQGPQVQE
jgi:hypothetical protein